MSSKIINNAFLFFSIVFFFVLMHVPFPTQELRLTDWALPSNLVAFSFAGILCSIGLFSIFIKKTISLSSVTFTLIFASLLMFIPGIFHFISEENLLLDLPIACIFLTLFYFALEQLNLNSKIKQIFLGLIAISGLLQGLLSILAFNGIDIQGKNFSFGSFNSFSQISTYTCISFSIILYLINTINFNKALKAIIGILSFVIVATTLYYTKSLIAMGILIILNVSYIIILLCKDGLKKISSVILLLLGTALVIYIGLGFNYECSKYTDGINNKLYSYSATCIDKNINNNIFDASISSFKNHLIFGAGNGSFERQILDEQINQGAQVVNFKPYGYNIILTTLVENGLFGISALAILFVTVIRICIRSNRNLNDSFMLLLIIIPYFILAIYENPFFNNFIFVITFTLIMYYIFTSPDKPLPQRKIRSAELTTFFAIFIPIAALTFSVTSINSLKVLHRGLMQGEDIIELKGKMINPLINYKYTNELETLKTNESSLHLGMDLITYESTEDLEKIAKYSINPKIFKALEDSYNHLSQGNIKNNINIGIKIDFAKEAQNDKKRYEILTKSLEN
ncbi:MAG: hypothetical protein UHG91_08685 [Succinivibrionaceae bacterium]|nr:hypothetical protein [Succinivibrionaceae bacterium]